jgi:hydrogenase-4 component F
MSDAVFFTLLLLIAPAAGLLSLLPSKPRQSLQVMLCGVFVTALIGAFLIYKVFSSGPIGSDSNWLRLDALSAYHLFVMLLVYVLSSLFAWVYFGTELKEGFLRIGQVKTFTSLWCPTMSTMMTVLVSNNLAVMWIAMEATTLLTAFLICIHMSRGVLEAMWKYVVICSVGTALAFMGTLLLLIAVPDGLSLPGQSLLWTHLMEIAPKLDPTLAKAAFIFLVVGYGTKSGLAPMHSWLPDAHSKAPSPVSALFSGFMLNAALYCVMRFLPIIGPATGNNGWPQGLLLGFGMISIIIAAAFILFQHNLKRLLAYHSIEHLGIIALGLGIGGLGTFAALFHALNHSLCKALSFFAAGRLGQAFGTHDMDKMPAGLAVSPLWGTAILASLLALIGVAPFSLFMSELQILKGALDANMTLAIVVFLIGTASVFVGALGHAVPLAWGKAPENIKIIKSTWLEKIIVIFPLTVLVVLGVYMPQPLRNALTQAASIIGR